MINRTFLILDCSDAPTTTTTSTSNRRDRNNIRPTRCPTDTGTFDDPHLAELVRRTAAPVALNYAGRGMITARRAAR
jgi:hypothetical protein